MSDAAGKKRCLFGTDGVRDIANRGAMTPEMALRLGRAYVLFLTERGFPRPKIVVGRDTRRSGAMLEAALIAGMTSAGADVVCVGVTPTPGVSFGVELLRAQGGAVISASHNPAEYNGIKFLDNSGSKLSDDSELAIEEYLGDNLIDDWRPSGGSIGKVEHRESDFNSSYVERVRVSLGEEGLGSLKVVFDCANGAASTVLPDVLSSLTDGGNFEIIGASPDGLNINEKSGVMSMKGLSERVVQAGYDIGIAYDGDADRVLLVDGKGRPLDGDIILWVLGRWLKGKGSLGAGIVTTVMSNMALDKHMAESGIKTFRCPVGDRYVLQSMKDNGSSLGGEQSGHVIAFPYTKTGDGICTGFLFIRACIEIKEDIQTLVDRFGRFPQKLTNIAVNSKTDIMKDDNILAAVDEASRILGDSGRIFLRPSGTEPIVRLLVECEDLELVESLSRSIEEKITSLVVN
ncbi:phosphoglucosamine mutase [Dethiosulfovibrio salsuginis]|uniref:Phosphoglucosamine mutase n=1 Tax=Dethiosulfovibrio salsuginis TaxID=561720 RepID=A0A1X7KQT3_9BACT|nr:phosphoglucosamine mutase [Dethiosulfovibrio salsuginis]SMG43647.1 phosphoglucosamine mutase [Dethiosulfovibrio salsuginis]